MLTLTDDPDPRLEDVLGDGLAEYNAEMSRRRDWRALAVTAHDPDSGALVGGLLGRTSLGLFFLDLFYLPKPLRGGGIGSQALRMAEQEAARRGCTAATLVTVNFQAPEFYAKLGYREFGRLDYPPAHQRIFLQKQLVQP